MRITWIAFALLAIGCQSPTLPDPNDPKLGAVEPEVLRRSLKGASNAFLERRDRGEIDDAQFQELMAMTAQRLTQGIEVENTDPKNAWEYGEVFRTARQWKRAAAFLQKAVEYAVQTKNEDRRVNDLLRLAHVQVMQGKVKEGIETARKSFDTPDEGAAPILPATLLEIVPNARGKGFDRELGYLLLDAIDCHVRTRVDPNSEAGHAFLTAKRHHIRNAFRAAIMLFRYANDAAGIAEVERRAQAFDQSTTSA
jgi:hypothetical protein